MPSVLLLFIQTGIIRCIMLAHHHLLLLSPFPSLLLSFFLSLSTYFFISLPLSFFLSILSLALYLSIYLSLSFSLSLSLSHISSIYLALSLYPSPYIPHPISLYLFFFLFLMTTSALWQSEVVKNSKSFNYFWRLQRKTKLSHLILYSYEHTSKVLVFSL